MGVGRGEAPSGRRALAAWLAPVPARGRAGKGPRTPGPTMTAACHRAPCARDRRLAQGAVAVPARQGDVLCVPVTCCHVTCTTAPWRQVPWLYQHVSIPLLYTRACTSAAAPRPPPPAGALLAGLAVLAAAWAGGLGPAAPDRGRCAPPRPPPPPPRFAALGPERRAPGPAT